MTDVTGHQHKALQFIGIRGKTEQAVADEYGSRQPLEIAELIAAGLVREANIPFHETQPAGDGIVVYYLTRAGAEAIGDDPDKLPGDR